MSRYEVSMSREAFETWYVDFYKEPLPPGFAIVHIYACWQAAIKYEREACAEIVEEEQIGDLDPAGKYYDSGLRLAAAAIRARSEP